MLKYYYWERNYGKYIFLNYRLLQYLNVQVLVIQKKSNKNFNKIHKPKDSHHEVLCPLLLFSFF